MEQHLIDVLIDLGSNPDQAIAFRDSNHQFPDKDQAFSAGMNAPFSPDRARILHMLDADPLIVHAALVMNPEGDDDDDDADEEKEKDKG